MTTDVGTHVAEIIWELEFGKKVQEPTGALNALPPPLTEQLFSTVVAALPEPEPPAGLTVTEPVPLISSITVPGVGEYVSAGGTAVELSQLTEYVAGV